MLERFGTRTRWPILIDAGPGKEFSFWLSEGGLLICARAHGYQQVLAQGVDSFAACWAEGVLHAVAVCSRGLRHFRVEADTIAEELVPAEAVGEVRGLSLAAGGGWVHLLYSAEGIGQRYIWHGIWGPEGWRFPEPLVSVSGDWAGSICLGKDGAGRLHLVFSSFDGLNYRLAHCMAWGEEYFWTRPLWVSSPGKDGFYPTLLADQVGGMHAVWVSDDGIPVYRYWKSGGWPQGGWGEEIRLVSHRASSPPAIVQVGTAYRAVWEKEGNLSVVPLPEEGSHVGSGEAERITVVQGLYPLTPVRYEKAFLRPEWSTTTWGYGCPPRAIPANLLGSGLPAGT